MNSLYIATIIHSILQSTTPILFAALGSAVCSQLGIFNVALEAQMLLPCFAAIAVDYFSGSAFLALLAGVGAGALVGLLVALLQVKYRAADMVVGTALNLLVSGLTSFLLFAIFGVRGKLNDPRLVPMPRFSFSGNGSFSFLGTVFSGLTILDVLSYVTAILLYIWLYKTVSGYHCQAVGLNKAAAESLGTAADRLQMRAVVLSGILCGLGGVALSMSNVTLFSENMTSGRGYIAMSAASMALNHPLAAIATSLFFGLCEGLGTALQSSIKSQLTDAIPYIGTILVMMIFSYHYKKQQRIR